jgi:hypothetical protein
MSDLRTTRGYALTGLMCIGGLGCGPGDAGEPTGYPMTGPIGADSGSGSGASTESEAGEATNADDSWAPECQYPGSVCGEMSLCQCSCDYSADCCECEDTTCTNDSHCPEGDSCMIRVEQHQHGATSLCVPSACAGAVDVWLLEPDADPSEFADVACAFSLGITNTLLVDLTAFANLEYVVEDITISANPMLATLNGLAVSEARHIDVGYNDNLTSIDALTSLTSIAGGSISCNPQLPTPDIEAVLAQIPGGDLVEVTHNGEGPC